MIKGSKLFKKTQPLKTSRFLIFLFLKLIPYFCSIEGYFAYNFQNIVVFFDDSRQVLSHRKFL